MGQNYGNLEASFYSDSIQGINIAAGASVYMGMKNKTDVYKPCHQNRAIAANGN